MRNDKAITPKRVALLVEDTLPDVLVLTRIMNEVGLVVDLHVVRDGEQALNFLYRRNGSEDAPRPSLIILDLSLPRLYGLEVLKTIKADKNLRRIPVIIFTTSDEEKDVTQAYESHVNAYIQKPPRLEAIYPIVEAIKKFWLESALLAPDPDEGS